MSGRSNRSFIQYPHDMVESDAWRALSGDAIKLLMGIACEYKGPETKPIVCSARQAKEVVGCGVNKITKLFNELTGHGFLDSHFRANFNVKNRRASEWFLSWLPHKDHRPSNQWRKWRSEKTRSLNPCVTVTKSVDTSPKSASNEAHGHDNSDCTVPISGDNSPSNSDTLYYTMGGGLELGTDSLRDTPSSFRVGDFLDEVIGQPLNDFGLDRFVIDQLENVPIKNSRKNSRQYNAVIRECVKTGFNEGEARDAVSRVIAQSRRSRSGNALHALLALQALPYRQIFPVCPFLQ